MKIIISGGGTGGHIFPAIAIANAIKEAQPHAEILFVGALGKMEMEKVPKAGYKIIGLPIVGIQRRLSLSNLKFQLKMLKSLVKARSIIKDYKPDIAIGVGGFASGPLLLMANALRIPTLIQEQNSYAGITNKFLAKQAKNICVAYPNMSAFFPKEKIVFTGNPVRSDLLHLQGKKEKGLAHFGLVTNKKTLLVIGGSLGAKSINQAIDSGLDRLLKADYQVIWQTGKPYFEKAKQQASGRSGVYVADFIYEMDMAYAAADLVVSRAGALSVSELCLVAKPCILVPYPHAAEDHQTQNALSLVQEQAAIMVKDNEAGQRLVDEVLALLQNEPARNMLCTHISKLAKPQAATEIAELVFEIIRNTKY